MPPKVVLRARPKAPEEQSSSRPSVVIKTEVESASRDGSGRQRTLSGSYEERERELDEEIAAMSVDNEEEDDSDGEGSPVVVHPARTKVPAVGGRPILQTKPVMKPSAPKPEEPVKVSLRAKPPVAPATFKESKNVAQANLERREAARPNRKSVTYDPNDLYFVTSLVFSVPQLHQLFKETNEIVGKDIHPVSIKHGTQQIRKPEVLARALAHADVRSLIYSKIVDAERKGAKIFKNGIPALSQMWIQFFNDGPVYPADSGDLITEANIEVKGHRTQPAPETFVGKINKSTTSSAMPMSTLPKGVSRDMVEILSRACLDDAGQPDEARRKVIVSILDCFNQMNTVSLQKELVIYQNFFGGNEPEEKEKSVDTKASSKVEEDLEEDPEEDPEEEDDGEDLEIEEDEEEEDEGEALEDDDEDEGEEI